jgi:hypothetical protein
MALQVEFPESAVVDGSGVLPVDIIHHGSPYLYIIWGMKNRPVGGRSSETFTYPKINWLS